MKNPITTLSEQLEKLINEHGSATILRDHLALFKDQVVMLEKKVIELAAKVVVLENEKSVSQPKIQEFKTKIEQLTKDNEELRSKIQKYEQPSHSNLLEEIRVNILLLLSKQEDELTDDDIAQTLKINPQIVKFHLRELEKYSMVHADLYINSPCKWYLAQEGRRYLIENKLIS